MEYEWRELLAVGERERERETERQVDTGGDMQRYLWLDRPAVLGIDECPCVKLSAARTVCLFPRTKSTVATVRLQQVRSGQVFEFNVA